MSRIRVALDCDIPSRITAPLNELYGDRGFEFLHVRALGHGTSEDEDWAKAFMQFGGQVAISADKRITKLPHKLLAFQEAHLKTYIMKPPWHDQRLHYKAAHLIYWWPAVERHLEHCVPGQCWEIPPAIRNGTEDGFKLLELPEEAAAAFRKSNNDKKAI